MEVTQTTKFHRQLDILSPTLIVPVLIIGCGAVGSAVGVMLAKLGAVDVTLFDDDTVEEHNVANQMFSSAAVGMGKVAALALAMRSASPLGADLQIIERAEKWDGTTVCPVVVMAVDSMETRREIYEKIKARMGVRFFIDCRMGGEMYRLTCGDPRLPDFQAFYEETLYSDQEAIELPCTARGVAYNTLAIAGAVGSLLAQFLRGESVPRELVHDLRAATLYAGRV